MQIQIKPAILAILKAVEGYMPFRGKLAVAYITWAVDKFLGNEPLEIELPVSDHPASVNTFIGTIFDRLAEMIPSPFVRDLIEPVKDYIVKFLTAQVTSAITQFIAGSHLTVAAMYAALPMSASGPSGQQPMPTPTDVMKLEGKLDAVFEQHIADRTAEALPA